jgi:SAM-dependent methyltransferase
MQVILISLLGVVLVAVVLALIFLATGIAGAPYVPSQKTQLHETFTRLYPLKSSDLLVDLGSGDGIVLACAAERGARAIGVELNPIMALLSRVHLRRNKKISIKCGNMYYYRLPAETTVVYAYANHFVIQKLYSHVQAEATRLGHRLYLISNAFDCQAVKPQKRSETHYLYRIEPAPPKKK